MSSGLTNPTMLLLVASFLAAPVTALAGWWRVRLAGPVAVGMAGLAFAASCWGWAEGGKPIDLQWAPTWGLRLQFQLDGLGLLYALLATGIGLLVTWYATAYLFSHLHHEQQPDSAATRFFALILLFMGAMVGLVLARDLLLIFLFWELTTVTSFFLIGFDAHKAEARHAALTAITVTGLGAIALLAGILVLAHETGNFALTTVAGAVQPGPALTTAGLLIAVAGLAKSAQAPLHFWLPRAMAAPTPVSAYLHSAAMVAAGVFLLSRFTPILGQIDAVRDLLLIIGFASIAGGGMIALTRDGLKQLLAYSTISQYGYVVVLIAIGGEAGMAGACLYVLAHALMKSALFLTAGAVSEATGASTLPELGGLARRMPWLAAGSGIAAAGLAGLPLTLGFFKDELYFHAALDRGGIVPVLAVLGAAMTLTYAWRFWAGIFLGSSPQAIQPIPARLTAPVVLLGALVLLGGLWTAPFARLASDAAATAIGEPIHLHLAYHFASSNENLMTLATFAVGILLIATRRVWSPVANAIAMATRTAGPRHAFDWTLSELNQLSDAVHRLEVRDLRSRVATILLPAGVLVGLAVLVQPDIGIVQMGSLSHQDLPLIGMVVIASASALVAAITQSHLGLSLLLSAVGYSLSIIYALLGAPDVALVAVLIETAFTILFAGMILLLPEAFDVRLLPRAETGRDVGSAPAHRLRDAALGVLAGLLALVVTWSVLSEPAALETIAIEQIRLSPSAHGNDVVTVILADFRGLDTMGEITVIGIAFLGVATLLRRRRGRA